MSAPVTAPTWPLGPWALGRDDHLRDTVFVLFHLMTAPTTDPRAMGECQRAGRAQGKVLYVRSYPNPSFGPVVEVCCSIIGVFKLLMHVLSIFTYFHPFFAHFHHIHSFLG